MPDASAGSISSAPLASTTRCGTLNDSNTAGAMRPPRLGLGTENLQHPAGAVIVVEAGLLAERDKARFAVMRDALHPRLVALETFGGAVAKECRQPAPLAAIGPSAVR